MSPRFDRRRFVRMAAQGAAAAALGRGMLVRAFSQEPGPPVRIGIIGFGVQGLNDANAARRVDNVVVTAAASCYDGHLERARELLGDAALLTRDYRQILDRRDIDAVIVSTPDHLLDRTLRPLSALVEAQTRAAPPRVPAAGRVRCALVGFGRRGLDLARAAAGVQQMEIVAVADAYEGRLERSREVLGASLVTSRSASAVIGRADVDAVLVATPDHLHATHVTQALDESKPVYCEHPIVHTADELPRVQRALAATLNGSGREQEIRLIGADATLVLRRNALELIPQPMAEPYVEVGDTWPEQYRRWVFMMHGLTPQGGIRGTPPVDKAAEQYTLPAAGHDLTPGLGAFVETVRSGQAVASLAPAAAADVARAGLMCTAALTAGRSIVRRDLFGGAA